MKNLKAPCFLAVASPPSFSQLDGATIVDDRPPFCPLRFGPKAVSPPSRQKKISISRFKSNILARKVSWLFVILLLLLVVAPSQSARAADIDIAFEELVSGGRIDAVASLGDGVVLMGSRGPNAGRIFRSTDYGESWTDLGIVVPGSGLQANITSLASAGDGTAYALTGTSDLWESKDWGQSWRALGRIHNNPRLGVFQHSYSIIVLSSGTMLVSDTNPSGGHIHRSVDGGQTWTQIGPISTTGLYRFELTDNGVLVNGWAGNIYQSTDDGQTWQLAGDLTTSPLYATVYLGDGVVLQGSEAGELFRSIDNGSTWEDTTTLNGAADDFASLGGGWVLYSTYTASREMYLSKDFGGTWESVGGVPTGVSGEVLDHFISLAGSDGDRFILGGTHKGYALKVTRNEEDAALRNDPIGHWYFDNAANLGEAELGPDLQVNNLNGSIQSITGPDGAAAIRVGLGDYLTLNRDGQPIVNDYTMVADIRIPDGPGQWRSLFNSGHPESNAHFWIDGNSGVMGHANLPRGYSSNAIQRDNWYRLVFYGSSRPGRQAEFRITVLDASGNLLFTELNAGTEAIDQQHALTHPLRFFFSHSQNVDHPIDVAALGLWEGIIEQHTAENLGAPGTPFLAGHSTQPEITLVSVESGTGKATLSFKGNPNTSYTCKSSSNLSSFPDVVTPISGSFLTGPNTGDGTGVGTAEVDISGVGDKRFYRLEAP